MRRLLPFIALTALLSCSGADKSKTSDSATEETVATSVTESQTESGQSEAEESPPDQGEGIPWNAKTDDQKGAYMKLTVKPKMEKLFLGFDKKRFDGEVQCSTCHGPDAKERGFEMPNPDLPRLDDWEKLEAEQPEIMEFMKKKVVPEMATLLDQKPFDPETKTGFGCGGCHPN